MSNYDFGNFNRDKDYSLYQIGKQKKATMDSLAAKEKEQAKEAVKFTEPKQTEAKSADVLGAYGKAFFDMNRKPDLAGLGLSANDQALVEKYITPEQQARIAENMLGYFA